MENKDLVWYVCYGSNLCYERFMRYINGCKDKSEPIKKEKFEIPYDLYFAEYTGLWGGAKAFIDITKPGKAYGVKYLITREQYEEVKLKEGSSYKTKVNFGKDKDGIDQLSFTQTAYKRDGNKPSQKYINIIIKGLLENYNLNMDEAFFYIKSNID